MTRTRAVLLTAGLLTLGCESESSAGPADADAMTMPQSEPTTTLKVGDAAPAFSLADAAGGTVSLADALATGPAVLVFYRGDW